MSNDDTTIDLDKALENAPTEAPNGRKLAKWERAIECSRARFDRIADGSLVNYERESLFAMQHLTKSDYAMKIAEGNPKSVILAMANVAATGLSLNPAYGLAHLLPRDGAIKLDISFKGLLQIATDSGSIMWGRADVVREADEFEYCGPAAAPIHKAKVFAADRGEIIGAYVIAKVHTGDVLCGVMTREELDTVRSKSDAWIRGAVGKKGPWETFPEEMCKKAVIKRDQKTWPRTDQHKRIADAIEITNDAEGGYTFGDEARVSVEDKRKERCDEAALQYAEAVAAIKRAIYLEDWPAMTDAWAQIPQAGQMDLFLAPTKGGVFSTHERDCIHKKQAKDALPALSHNPDFPLPGDQQADAA